MTFEKSLVSQCSPTLASLKTGNLFNIHYVSIGELQADISLWNNLFKNKGIKIFILKYTKLTALIYVYRESALLRDLCKADICNYLSNYGYPFGNLDETLKNLQIRLHSNDNFPHEIGLFLSYPLEDVTGFINNKGENCSHCGHWKVYGDKSACVKKFQLYDKCKDIYLNLWENGRSILQLTVAI